MRGFSLLETLVVITLISIMISMTFYFRWDDTKKELLDSRALKDATTELWLIRMKDPNQEVFWVWESEDGVMWMMSRSDNAVRKVNP